MVLFFALVLFLGEAAVMTLQDVGGIRSIGYFSCCIVNSKSIYCIYTFASVVAKQSGSSRDSATVWANSSNSGMCPMSTCTH